MFYLNFWVNNSWIPSDPSKAGLIPPDFFDKLKKIYPDEVPLREIGSFYIMEDSYNKKFDKPQYHLVFYRGIGSYNASAVSVYRCDKVRPLAVLCDSCRLYPELFDFVKNPEITEKRNIIGANWYSKLTQTLDTLSRYPILTSFHLEYMNTWKYVFTPNSKDTLYHTAQVQAGKEVSSIHKHAFLNNLNELVEAVSKMGPSDDINFKDCHGNTALHLAVYAENLDMVRFLLCMGSDPNIVNNAGQTPLHLASLMQISMSPLFKDVDDKTENPKSEITPIIESLLIARSAKCSKHTIGCTDHCIAVRKKTSIFEATSYTHLETEVPSEAEKLQTEQNRRAISQVLKSISQLREAGQESNVINALSLDGGGIKGVALLQILIGIEERLDNPIKDYLDWVAGTSTGSIVAAGIGLDMPLRQIQRIYFSLKDQIFGPLNRLNTSDKLEKCLQKSLGHSTTLDDISYPRMIFPTMKADVSPAQLILQRNYRLPVSDKVNKKLGFTDPSETKVWNAIRRSTAAPGYFKPSEGIYVDGGLAANNPSIDLLSEIHSWNRHVKLMNLRGTVKVGCLLSIGCGIGPVQERDLNSITSIFGVLFEGIAMSNGPIVDRNRECCHSADIPFFRITPNVSKVIDLATTDNKALIQFMWESYTFAQMNSDLLDEIADLLESIGTNEHRRRLLNWQIHKASVTSRQPKSPIDEYLMK